MEYKIQILKNGECDVPDWCLFNGERAGKSYRLALFVWVIHGGERPILIETTCKDIDVMNVNAAHVMSTPIALGPDEDPDSLMAAAGIDPSDVSHVFITHLHYDHCSNLEMFPNAVVVISAKGHQAAVNKGRYLHTGFREELKRLESEGRLLAVDDTEVLPGISVMWLGGHSPCDQAVIVNTRIGRVAFPGDVVMMYRNFEENIPVGIYTNKEQAQSALDRLRAENVIVVPSHDMEVLERYPSGFIE